jgi:PAS domain S-box-containing protein
MDPAGTVERESLVGMMAANDLLNAIITMSDDAIFTCDRLGLVVSWSATAERLFGCPAHQVLDRHFEVLFPPHLSSEVQGVVATVMAGDRIRRFETEALRPNGMPIPVSLSLCPILDEDNAPIGAVVIARDVTEQQLAQATLAEIVARMEEGEEMAHIGSWVWDLRTGAVQWSNEFHRIHAVDPLEFDGTFDCYLSYIHPDDRNHVRLKMAESLRSGRPVDLQYRPVRADGEQHEVQVRAQPALGSDGAAVGLRGIGQDVTHRPDVRVSRTPPGS